MIGSDGFAWIDTQFPEFPGPGLTSTWLKRFSVDTRIRSGGNHFEWVDILRGLASLGVVLFHSRVDLWVGWNELRLNPENFSAADRLIAWLSLPLPFLGPAVILFFVLSGFCIHYPAAGTSNINLRAYAIRRFVRIVPPYLAAVVLSLLIEVLCRHLFDEPTSNASTIYKTFFMLQNYPPLPGQIVSNPSLWSLPVEVQLYIAYPLIFLTALRFGNRATFLSVGIVSLIASLLAINIAPWMQTDFLKYWIIWCAGCGLGEYAKFGKIGPWRLALYFPLVFLLAVAIFITKSEGVPQPAKDFVWAGGYFFLVWRCLTLPEPERIIFTIYTPKSLVVGENIVFAVPYSLSPFSPVRTYVGFIFRAKAKQPFDRFFSFLLSHSRGRNILLHGGEARS